MLALLYLGLAASLEQFTPDKADWSTFHSKAAHLTDHSPDGIDWLDSSVWEDWDGTAYDPSQHSKADFAKLICPTGDKVRGIRTLFYEHNPFADLKNPTKAEVDEWHRLALNHVRAMVGYTAAEYQIQPDKCLHLRALWSDERMWSRMWDATYEGTCEGDTNPHCGAGFIPSVSDQQPYLPADIESCGTRAGSEGLFNAAKANIPWSIKWSRPFCQTLGAEGFWGGHTGPWFHRSLFGWSWWDGDTGNANSNAGLRAKWSGPSGASLYIDPDITSGRFLVNGQEPRFPGFECEGRVWGDEAGTATECYERMLADASCGKRFMTYNSGGCACYPVDLASCVPSTVSGRLTWDFVPVPSSVRGYILPDTPLHSGKRCQDIIWKYTAGDAFDCLEKLMTEADPACGTTYMTWNSANGGCACYPPEQDTCTTTRESGRETYELQFDSSYDNDIQVDAADDSDMPVDNTSNAKLCHLFVGIRAACYCVLALLAVC